MTVEDINIENSRIVVPPREGAILTVRDLNVRFNTENGVNHAVRGVDFDLVPGRTLGIVGESGSGKSVTSMAIMGLLPDFADITGSVDYRGQELLELDDKSMSKIRGKEIAMVFQDPLSSLTPVYTIGDQVIEALTIHNPGMSAQAKEARAVELLTLVGIPSPKERLKAYPHEFSGGMRQRVMIAIAIANNPDVLIADESTTALDVTIQAQVLEVLRAAQEETGAAVVMITHDLGVVAGYADDILVMYGGRGVESGTVDDIYYQPRMPYTLGLLGSIPRVDIEREGALVPINGNPPNLLHPPIGCSFAARCPMKTEECEKVDPRLEKVPGSPEHVAACLHSEQLLPGTNPRDVFPVPDIGSSAAERLPRDERPSILKVDDLVKHFPLMKGTLFKKRIGTVKAVDGVSFDVKTGECFSLVGESGSGKTTTLLEVMEFEKSQPGNIEINGIDNHTASGSDVQKTVRSNVQMVFQDPTGALDPRFTVFEVIAEPLQTQGFSKADVKKRVLELMKLVGLETAHVNRFPNQFSGGQRQRIGIARAIATNPKLVVLDEPVSALDVSVQAGVINLLEELKNEFDLSYMMVAHDLAVVRHISDRVAVMYLGKIVEIGDVDSVFDNPIHPYTRALLSAIPIPDPKLEHERERIILEGDLPTPLKAPKGCGFVTRCPIFKALPEDKKSKCLDEVPPLMPVGNADGEADHQHACFYPDARVAQEALVRG